MGKELCSTQMEVDTRGPGPTTSILGAENLNQKTETCIEAFLKKEK